MRYMVLKHVGRMTQDDLWYVADMHHPELSGKITKKPLSEALRFCERMNKGERFWDCNGEETYDQAMLRFWHQATNHGHLAPIHKTAMEYVRNRSRRLIQV